ncbi:H-type lectin domain-containing protein [Pukyongiella litopenaei]|uniref:H-type lectin domain-containing protein n=1 Tax=Pukyongiella litopenaei TaxID=2605946 RepID=A0A2S0MMG2_9RHOB|nr:H-type lectin domain-containing protein [Pukyongiella litopenaei]AVO36873.1 hypothetical protein C6Y53_03635 [Pukyongiella litopenaei]
MKTLQNHRIGIEQGEVLMFSDFEHGGEMWSGDGPRECCKSVRFPTAFRNAPAVQVAVVLWDVSPDAALRAELRARDITPDGFELVFNTWGDTRIARLRVSWMAIGEAAHDDDWDLG